MSAREERPCGATYGSNPDACYQPEGHKGTHSNRWGTTWAGGGAAAEIMRSKAAVLATWVEVDETP